MAMLVAVSAVPMKSAEHADPVPLLAVPPSTSLPGGIDAIGLSEDVNANARADIADLAGLFNTL